MHDAATPDASDLHRSGGDAARVDEVGTKLARVRHMLAERGYGGALLTSQANVSWITAGLQDPVIRGEDPGLVWVLVTPDACSVISPNVESERLVAEEGVKDLGEVELRTYEWWRPAAVDAAVQTLVDPTTLLNDGWGPGDPHPEWLQVLRFVLTPSEARRLKALGGDCCEVLEGALHEWQPGGTERDVTGAIASGLEARGVFPSVLMVGGDERRRRFRHPISSSAAPRRDLLAVLVGVRRGLNVALSRSVAAGEPAADLARDHAGACAVEAALVLASRPGMTWQAAFAHGVEAYRAAGRVHEWQLHFQGGPIGYKSRDFDVVPDTEQSGWSIRKQQAFAWNPSIGGAKSEDTFIAEAEGPVAVTNSGSWPLLTFDHPTGTFRRPAILSV